MKMGAQGGVRSTRIWIALVILLIAAVAAWWLITQPPAGNGTGSPPPAVETLGSLLNQGKGLYEKGDAVQAVALFEKAHANKPGDPAVRLNLANAYLLAARSDEAIRAADEVLKLLPDSAAAHYVKGCAYLRKNQWEPALIALQQSAFIEPDIATVHFQIGRAFQLMSKWEDAAAALGQAVRLDAQHPTAHYALSQVLVRLGSKEAADVELKRHQAIAARSTAVFPDGATFERCEHTLVVLPALTMEQPDEQGVKVVFADATEQAFGGAAAKFGGPFGVIDLRRDGQSSLWAREGTTGFRLLANQAGVFSPQGDPQRSIEAATYSECLVGDLQNDRFDDVILLSDKGAQVFTFGKGGEVTDVSALSGLQDVTAMGGVLADLDFTGKLGLVVATPGGVRVLRNEGNVVFKDITATSGVPPDLVATQLTVDHMDADDLPDLVAARADGTALLFANQHGGLLKASDGTQPWPVGAPIATGDVDNDLHADFAAAQPDAIEIVCAGGERKTIKFTGFTPRELQLIDYDNDGWLDVCASGQGVRIWRNLGAAGFREVTAELGLVTAVTGEVAALRAADFDSDGDPDLMVGLAAGGLQFLRNDGANANGQIKIRLEVNRSNGSGFGVRLELTADDWRTSRTVKTLPVEIGVGKHRVLDTIGTHWSDLRLRMVKIDTTPKNPLVLNELELPTGSCPNLYAWDGTRFRYVTDLLGASPAGLRLTDDRFIDADTDEYVWIGDETMFQPRDGSYVLQITDELREILYLDEAKLLVVDHPVESEVHATSKLRPSGPFPKPEIVTIANARAALHASDGTGRDCTALLAQRDDQVVGPVKLRVPQLRGLAEPYTVTLDFGPLAVERPLVLAITAWLRFGGGMANVAASHNPNLPFPFPSLEVEIADGAWQTVDVVAGAPAGKTKNLIVDLKEKLPAGSRRLRITTAFEIYWDRIALGERETEPATTVAAITPTGAHLHWHGYGEYEDWPPTRPLTPRYDVVRASPPWRITPMGWCTRYGDVAELVAQRDDALVILNGGDEVTLTFDAADLPPKQEGMVREFFLASTGWDKDADYHVERGYTVEPLPFHGMDDQLYGRQPRPVIDGDWWIEKYNTRWVGPLTLTKER